MTNELRKAIIEYLKPYGRKGILWNYDVFLTFVDLTAVPPVTLQNVNECLDVLLRDKTIELRYVTTPNSLSTDRYVVLRDPTRTWKIKVTTDVSEFVFDLDVPTFSSREEIREAATAIMRDISRYGYTVVCDGSPDTLQHWPPSRITRIEAVLPPVDDPGDTIH